MNFSTNCEGCAHYRPISRSYVQGALCCHHLLDTGRRCERDGHICLSRNENYKQRANKFDIPIPQR